jgi:twitching motility protein PilT
MAESGHLVFSTIHAKNSMQCITKITDVFPWDKQNLIRNQLSEWIAWIITQKLIKKKDWSWLKLVMEIMINNSAVSSVIRENNLHQLESIIQMNKMSWMILLDESILAAVSSWDISWEEAINSSNSPEAIWKILSENWYI